MKKVRYFNQDKDVLIGDKVQVKIKKNIFFSERCNGVIDWVCDLSKPPVREKNDYGVSIKLNDGASLWVDVINDKLDQNVYFIE